MFLLPHLTDLCRSRSPEMPRFRNFRFYSKMLCTAYREHLLLTFLLCTLFSHLTLPPRLNSSLLSLTVFLSVSCLESQPVGQPRARKFVSSGAAERGGYLLRRVKSTGGHMGPFSHCGLAVVVSGTSSLERHPAWEQATGSSV